MTHGQRQRAVGALFRGQPLIANLGDFCVIGGDRYRFGAFVTDFGEEVGVWRTGLRNVGTPGDNIRGVVPVSGFRHVRLLAPGLRRGRWQIAIPVVEAQTYAADKRQIARTGCIRHHRHRRDWREADNTVRAESFGGIHVRCRDQLIHFLPAGTHETAASASGFIFFGFFRLADD